MIFAYLMIGFGFVMRLICARKIDLGVMWRVAVPNKLVTDGLYNYVRHPLYTGALFMYTGLIYASTANIFFTIVMFSLMVSFILDRIDREENILYHHFGDEYVKYINKVRWVLCPFIM